MAWATPVIHATGDVVSASDWNIGSNDLSFLFGDAAWTSVPSFSGTWVAGSPAPAYLLVGRVAYLRGVVLSGTIGTAAFTLPSGYRPSQMMHWSNEFNGAFGYGVINTTGTVVPTAGSTAGCVLDSSFPVV